MPLKDVEHPFFRPLWRRVALVAVCLVWAAIEWVAGDQTWTMITLAIAAYAAWTFLYRYDPSRVRDPAAPEGRDAPGA